MFAWFVPFLSMFLLAAVAATPAGAQFRLPPDTRLMTDDELGLFFSARSWVREKSVGYFSEENSEFLARSDNGGSARGQWSLPGSGRLCIDARWTWGKGKLPVPVRECYAHRTDGVRVFQRREPFGSWRIFKDAPPHEWTDINRLVPEDRLTMPVNLLAK
jgi:hypothetical protein